jgi:hypothetical protein
MTDEKPEKPHIWWSRLNHKPSIKPFEGSQPYSVQVVAARYSVQVIQFYAWRAGLQSRGYVGWPQI